MARQRERIRRKALVTDSTSALDLANIKPMFSLRARGKGLWKHFEDETPFWWNAADVPMAAMLCAVTDACQDAMKDATPNQLAIICKEWRQLAGELGLSPTSRGRLRLTEAQSTVASKRVEALEAERERGKSAEVIDIEDLLADG